MIYVAAFALLVALVTVMSAAGLLRSLLRQHGRERDRLLDRIMHLAGKTWMPPPSDTVPDVPPADDLDRYVFSPSQFPDDEE